MFWADLVNIAKIYNPIQVHIPRQKSSQSFVFQLKCEVNSRISHNVLISKTIRYKSYKEICSGEPKKVNLGFNNDYNILKVKNNTLMPYPPFGTYLYGEESSFSYDWEILSKFFSLHNIEPNWLDCGYSWGSYDEEQGGWTGCIGKV